MCAAVSVTKTRKDRGRPTAERGNIGGRVKRYVKVGGAVSTLAARLAGSRYLGIGLDRDRHAGELRNALGGLKGPLMKVAQILATIPDALPEEYSRELAHLQADAPAMGWPFVRRRMMRELGVEWEDRFAAFERSATHAASLGQVHRATHADGRELACKLQYPDMASAVEADLKQLKLVLRLYERYDNAISTAQIHAELSARLHEELDYDRELCHLQLYRAMLDGEAGVQVPDYVRELSTKRLLTMTWLEGSPLVEFTGADLEKRNEIAQNLFRAWYRPFYLYGIIHGDPHLGNYSVCGDNSINLLDFGCIRVFPSTFVEGVIDLYRALRDKDRDLAVHAYETWGFQNLNNEVMDVLNIWAEFIYGPLLEDRMRGIQEESGLYGAKVAGKVHRELRRLGGVTPPREFVLMDRAAIGLGSVFMHLRAEINWHRVFHELIENFNAGALMRRQRLALEAAGVPEAA
jgi:predicted unusual protein kinase regulating ubiquinone biosynthesis (AarF/ABC1/UbiB family)